jgi:putative transposase
VGDTIVYVERMQLHNSCASWRLTYHFVWGPMRARPVLVGNLARRLAELIREKADLMQVTLRALEIQPDRIYLVVDAPPTLSPHRIVCGLKAHSSGPLRREFRELMALPTLWTRHYLVAAGEGLTVEQVLAAFDATRAPRRPRGRPRRACHPA